jgi:hypothetical protein
MTLGTPTPTKHAERLDTGSEDDGSNAAGDRPRLEVVAMRPGWRAWV